MTISPLSTRTLTTQNGRLMPEQFTPEQRATLLDELSQALTDTTIQGLRAAAKLWGWSLRGTGKSELVQQMAGYLGDAARMKAAVQALSTDEIEALGWIPVLPDGVETVKSLQAVMAHGSGHQMTQKAAVGILQGLIDRCLVFGNVELGYYVPSLFWEWRPAMAVSRLRYSGTPETVVTFTAAELNGRIENLLAAIETHPAEVVAAPVTVSSMYAAPGRVGDPIVSRPGLVSPETLRRYNCLTPDEQALARFLLETLTDAGVLQITTKSGPRQLAVSPDGLAQWQDLHPLARVLSLSALWYRQPQAEQRIESWCELDLALAQVQGYTLRQAYGWTNADVLTGQVRLLRAWLFALVMTLPEDSWLDVGRFTTLIHHLHRDLFTWGMSAAQFRWQRDRQAIEAHQMDPETWRATYGKLVEAWLTGPAYWLGLAQPGYQGGRLVAFRRLTEPPAGEAVVLPQDALIWLSPTVTRLVNTWQTAELRRLLHAIGTETGRSRDATEFTLRASAFRTSLSQGLDTERIAQAFAAAGFPLPPATRAILTGWQGKAGRHQLYDNLAVIEFGTDMHPEEVRAIASLRAGVLYPVAPRCLVVLDPDVVPGLVDELRRRGYTPQVLS